MSSTPKPDTTSAQPAATPPPKRRGMQGNAKSMVLSMIACIAGCLVLLALIPRQGATQRPTVPGQEIARETKRTTGWDVALASRLGSPWRAVNVAMINGDEDHMKHWQAGYQGKGDDFIAVEQTKKGGTTFVRQMASGSTAGSVDIDGVRWTKVNVRSGDQRALVRTAPLAGLDTLVVGKGSWEKLQKVAQATQPFSSATTK